MNWRFHLVYRRNTYGLYDKKREQRETYIWSIQDFSTKTEIYVPVLIGRSFSLCIEIKEGIIKIKVKH